MNKINFQDLPSTETPINSKNLNQMQANVENAINQAQDNMGEAINSMSANDWVFDLRQIGEFDISTSTAEINYDYSDLPTSLMYNAVVVSQVGWFKAFARATLYDGNRVKVYIENLGQHSETVYTGVSVLLIYRKSILD